MYDLSKTELQDHFCLQTLALRGSNVKVEKQSKMKSFENFKSRAIFSEVIFMKNKFLHWLELKIMNKKMYNIIPLTWTQTDLQRFKVFKTTRSYQKCDLDDILLNFANRLLLNHDKPAQWSTSNIIRVPKKGDLSKAGNYRGISLNAISAKLVNRLILNRIQPTLDKKLRSNQNGFRPGRSTQSQILALRRLIEGVKARHLPAVILFVDFRKAFDSIHRGKMLKILAAYGIPNELLNAIDILYKDTRAKVVSPDGETEYFNIVAGVLQGDTLAPYLFIIVLDYIMRHVMSKNNNGFTVEERKSRRIPEVKVTDLDFADDIALISNLIDESQRLLNDVETAASKVGLHLNAKKTEVMIFNQPNMDILSQSGEKIKIVNDFKYLGSMTPKRT